MQTTGYLVSATAEFTAGMQDRKYDFHGRKSCFTVDADRNTASVINDRDRIAGIDMYFNAFAVSGKCFIYGIIHNFINKMVKTTQRSGSDIHTGTLSYGFETFQDLDLVGTVFSLDMLAFNLLQVLQDLSAFLIDLLLRIHFFTHFFLFPLPFKNCSFCVTIHSRIAHLLRDYDSKHFA